METELFFHYLQFNEEDDDTVEPDKQSSSFDDGNGNIEDKEPDGNISGKLLWATVVNKVVNMPSILFL